MHPAPPRLALVAALAENRVIGVDNHLPWHLPDDLKHFRRITTGHSIIMGRRNYESIGRPLPDRRNIVITRQTGYSAPGCIVVHTLPEAIAAAEGDEVFVIGGAELYAQTLDEASRLYLTLVHAEVEGDTRFPPLDAGEWREISRERHEADARHAYAFSFVIWDRKPA